MKSPFLGSALALCSLTSAQALQAQNVCVAPEDAADAVVYMMPLAYEAAKVTCESELGDESFLFSSAGEAFAEKFRGQQDARWAGTIRLFRVFINKEQDENDAMGEMIVNLPDDALRPFVDGIMQPIISQEIKPESCAKIDRVVELMSPLPAENVGGLIAFILPEVDVKDPPICGSKAAEISPPLYTPAPPPSPEPQDEATGQ